MRTMTHLLVTSERICDKGASITNGSRALSSPFQWKGMGRSTTADAISRVLRAVRYIASIWSIHKTKSGHGILW
jgi:hypothetical protein